MFVRRILESTESLRAVDGPAATVQRSVRRVLGRGGLDRFLRGAWLGHPVHPLLVAVPIGAWTCSSVLDIGFDQPVAARRLMAIGLAATPPTVVTGLADFSRLDPTQRRVALLHAGANAVAAGLYLRAVTCRNRSASRAWACAGLTALAAGGALGGHLSYALGAGVGRWQQTSAESGPEPGGVRAGHVG